MRFFLILLRWSDSSSFRRGIPRPPVLFPPSRIAAPATLPSCRAAPRTDGQRHGRLGLAGRSRCRQGAGRAALRPQAVGRRRDAATAAMPPSATSGRALSRSSISAMTALKRGRRGRGRSTPARPGVRARTVPLFTSPLRAPMKSSRSMSPGARCTQRWPAPREPHHARPVRRRALAGRRQHALGPGPSLGHRHGTSFPGSRPSRRFQPARPGLRPGRRQPRLSPMPVRRDFPRVEGAHRGRAGSSTAG